MLPFVLGNQHSSLRDFIYDSGPEGRSDGMKEDAEEPYPGSFPMLLDYLHEA